MKLKAAGVLPLFAIVFFFSSAFCEKIVEVTIPITKVHFLPMASSETRGYVRKGQRFVVDGESGLWYRISYNNTKVWVSKEAAKPIEPIEADAGHAPAHGSVQSSGFTHEGTPLAPPRAQLPAAAAPIPPGAKSAIAESIAAAAKPVAPAEPIVNGVVEGAPAAQPAAVTPREPVTPAPLAATPPVRRPRKPFVQNFGVQGSQFSHIPRLPSGESDKEIAFFQVSINETPVFAVSNDSATILTKVKKGEYFPLIEETDSWCKIVFNDTAGWIERSKGSIVNTPASGAVDEIVLISIIAAVLVIGTVALLLLMRRKSRARAEQTAPFHALLIGKSAPSVQCIVSNKTISLEKYLSVIGFTVKTAHDLVSAPKAIAKQPPDVAFIDWSISSDIPGTIEILFADCEDKKLPLTIFYNVPSSAESPLIPILMRTFQLGSSFSDHDISKLITPTMLSRTGQRSMAGSALEGDIAEGNLPEIMQFIEIGKKTGCLLIDTARPVGMIFFAQGRIVHAAAANGLYGRKAINSLLGLKDGKFRFLLDKAPKVSDLNLSTLEVLMEWTKTEDEAHRN
jgi:hypothetical protein